MPSLTVIQSDGPDQLAHALCTMTKFREHCLSRPQGGVVNVGMMQLIVDEDEELSSPIVVCRVGVTIVGGLEFRI